ncbi:retinal-binding protein-like [Gigantopelta aegis]|uniref:retinal-binding protein-like n=1 Tax=Gigantopelta aegis TaxID=1735272 RepID=UPI001B88998B|nr:retinal-binding protein-like [Gigantopelta aegis]XP_041350513.1 retinal-binding protein-like [Gigantopelta aegis]XP_041350514.1 retinal-binding protein-like [Gigantopelta aegis]
MFKKKNSQTDTSSANGKVLSTKETKKMAALTEFKSRIADLLKPEYDDYYLTKWLKARQFDVSKAEQMFRASMEFREKMNVDKLLEEYEPPEVLQKYMTGGTCGHDKDGSPVRIELYGHLDMKGLMYSAKTVDLEKTKLLQCERHVRDWKQQSQKLGRRVDGLTVIFDMEGVSSRVLWRPGIQMYLHLVTVLEDNYPEMMKKLFVVNAPRIFPVLYKICRPLISEDMKNKIHVLGGNFTETLLKYVDENNLPAYLGGKLTDPDGNPRCVTKIVQGGEVPQSYYLAGKQCLDNMESKSIGRGDKLVLPYVVEKPGSIIRWEFKTDEYDIGFGIFLVKDGRRVPVMPVERVNSHMVPQDGSLTCDDVGTYDLCFDNTFSWARSKKILFNVEVVSPDDDLKSEIEKLIEGVDNINWEQIAQNSDKFETTHF